MPELLRLQTIDYELSIWVNDIQQRKCLYEKTLLKRGENNSGEEKPAQVRFSPPMTFQQLSIDAPSFQSVAALSLPEPLFFENVQYQFEWVFFGAVDEAHLAHRSHLVNEGFRFAHKGSQLPARLTGTINTGNDVGWMRLPLVYRRGGESVRHSIAFEVLPTKMLLHQDLPAMYQAIDQSFPLWRFSLVAKTDQDAAKGVQRGHFPLMWLANFAELRQQFEQGLKVITQAPHRRLQPFVSYSKAVRLSANVSSRLAEKL